MLKYFSASCRLLTSTFLALEFWVFSHQGVIRALLKRVSFIFICMILTIEVTISYGHSVIVLWFTKSAITDHIRLSFKGHSCADIKAYCTRAYLHRLMLFLCHCFIHYYLYKYRQHCCSLTSTNKAVIFGSSVILKLLEMQLAVFCASRGEASLVFAHPAVLSV